MTAEPFSGFAILELMGHRRLAGHVEDVEMFGGRMLRLDVYPGDATEPVVTQFLGVAAVYALTPCSETLARQVAVNSVPRPVAQFELEAPLWTPPRDDSHDRCNACGHDRCVHNDEGGACTDPDCHDEDGEACQDFREDEPF